ncbi:1832_t:CDS:1, partial [Gigaspora rosea]
LRGTYYPPQHTRCAENHRKEKRPPPRPLNKFLLFRRDFIAKQKKNGRNMNLKDASKFASYEWHNNLTDETHRFFEILEQLAKEKHRQRYGEYTYSPKKNREKKFKNTNIKNTKTGQISIIQFEKPNQIATEFSEPTSEASAIENMNVVTENNHSESPNFGLLNYDELFLFDSSTGLLPLDIQNYFGMNNFEHETTTSFYQENLNGYGCQPNVNF